MDACLSFMICLTWTGNSDKNILFQQSKNKPISITGSWWLKPRPRLLYLAKTIDFREIYRGLIEIHTCIRLWSKLFQVIINETNYTFYKLFNSRVIFPIEQKLRTFTTAEVDFPTIISWLTSEQTNTRFSISETLSISMDTRVKIT